MIEKMVSFSKKEHTLIPDLTFPISFFDVSNDTTRFIPLHWHEHLEWLVIVKGAFRVQIGSTFQDLVAGDVAFINSKQVHAAEPHSKQSALYAIVFNEALIRNTGLDLTDQKYIIPLLTGKLQLPNYFKKEEPETAQLRQVLLDLYTLSHKKHFGYELIIKAKLLESIGYAFQKNEQMPLKTKQKETALIDPLLKFLSTHFTEALSVKDAAKICCLSPNYFCTVFKKATGKTLIEYIHLLRIQEAERLMQTTSLSIQQIAYTVGFSNLTYFGRTFKKFKQLTPTHFREQLLN